MHVARKISKDIGMGVRKGTVLFFLGGGGGGIVAHCVGGSKVLVLLLYLIEQTSTQCTQLSRRTAIGTLFPV